MIFSDDCRVTEWTEWLQCSSKCGPGIKMRTRNYIYEQKARQSGCLTNLIEKENCEGNCVGDIPCETTSWSEWSECNVSCGKGTKIRTRKFMDRRARKACAQIELVEKEPCIGQVLKCTDFEGYIDPKCNVTPWTEWSACSATCGKGIRIRSRLYTNNRIPQGVCNVELFQKAPCVAEKLDCAVDINQAKG